VVSVLQAWMLPVERFQLHKSRQVSLRCGIAGAVQTGTDSASAALEHQAGPWHGVEITLSHGFLRARPGRGRVRQISLRQPLAGGVRHLCDPSPISLAPPPSCARRHGRRNPPTSLHRHGM